MDNAMLDGQQTVPMDASIKECDNFFNASEVTQSRVNSQTKKAIFKAIYIKEKEKVLMLKVEWQGRTYGGTLLTAESNDWCPPILVKRPTEKVDKFWKRKQPASPREKKGLGTYFQMFPHTTVHACNLVGSKLRYGRGDKSVTSTPANSDDESNCLSRRKGNSKKIAMERGLDQKNISSDSIKSDSFDDQQSPPRSYVLMKEPNSPNVKSNSKRKKENIQQKNLPQF